MNLPPGPALPAPVQTLIWTTRPLPFLYGCRERYGELFTIRLTGLAPLVFVHHPEGIKQVFTAPTGTLVAGEANVILEPVLGPESLLLLDGGRHRRTRRLLMPPFHGKRMRAYGEIIRAATERVIAGWQEGAEIKMIQEMQKISLDVILRAVFGIEDSELEEARARITDMTDRITGPMVYFSAVRADLGPWSPGGRFKRASEAVDALIAEQIRRRRASEVEGEDILSLLLTARDEDGQPMSDAELRDQLITLLVAGHETTATALSWAYRWMLEEPEVLAKLEAELEAAHSTEAGAEVDALAKLPYVNAVCDEALRRVPVLPIVTRIVKQPFTLMGTEIPVGARVAPCIYLAHHREETWTEPLRFMPERFLGRTWSPYEYLPFGGGERRCVGQAFARYEMCIVLATLAARARLALTAERQEPARRGITLAPTDGLPLKVVGLRGVE
ncbi:MAG: cytochrome P450 [Alphaproteobacteria bacterium]|nr:cytochrome P450 [Alphaproteobacteria bacterium]MCB9797609.1 cytochrome P450 [Alphaproteobacteria bacterium]